MDKSQAYSTIGRASARSRMMNEDMSPTQMRALEVIRRGSSIPPHQFDTVLDAAQGRGPSQERRAQYNFDDVMREAERTLQRRQREGEATGAITKQPQSTPKATPYRPVQPPSKRNIFKQPQPVAGGARQREGAPVAGEAEQREGATGGRENRRRERAPERNSRESSPSAAEKLQLQMAMMLMNINKQLGNRSTSAPPAPRSNLKLQAVQLPSVKRTASGEVSPREYHIWKHNVSHTISHNGISEEDILIHYANNTKLLPEEWQLVFMQSTSLRSAIFTLDTFFPPVSDLSQELIMEMTKKGPVHNNSESTKLARVTSLLKTLDTWIRLFHDSVEDMTRSEALIVVFHLNASGENKAELVEQTVEFERAKQRGVKYTTSLKSYLLRHRLVYTDILAAVKSIGKLDPPKTRSASTREVKRGDKKNGGDTSKNYKKDEKNDKGKGKSDEEKKNKEGGKKDVKCDLCGGQHPNYLCKQELQKIAAGEKKLASHVCQKCLRRKDSKDHDSSNCYLARTFKNGVFLRTSWLCQTCNSVHFRLCAHNAGPSSKVDEDQTKKVTIRSCACRMIRLPAEDDDEEHHEQEQGVHPRQERDNDPDVQLPGSRRHDQEDQEDGGSVEHGLPQQGLLHHQKEDQDSQSSGEEDEDSQSSGEEDEDSQSSGEEDEDSQFDGDEDQDLHPDEDGEVQPEQELQVRQGGEERERGVQGAGVGGQLEEQGGQQVTRGERALQSSPSTSRSETSSPENDPELEELYRRIKEVWTLSPTNSTQFNSAATRAFSAASEAQNGQVIFQTDTLLILGKDGTTAKCHVSYDNHGSQDYLSGNLPEQYDFHNGQRTASFKVATIHGSNLNNHTLATIKLVTLRGIIPINTVSADWIGVDQEPQLPEQLAEKHNISVPKEADTSLRLILGAGQLVNHPRPIFIPPRLKEEQPGLVLFKSQLSGLVIAGGLFNH